MNDISYPYDWDDVTNDEAKDDREDISDPWVNGRYAFAALAWGLVALIVLTIGGQA